MKKNSKFNFIIFGGGVAGGVGAERSFKKLTSAKLKLDHDKNDLCKKVFIRMLNNFRQTNNYSVHEVLSFLSSTKLSNTSPSPHVKDILVCFLFVRVDSQGCLFVGFEMLMR